MFITGFEVKDCLYITNKEIRSIKSTMKENMQLYQNQFAATIADMVGLEFVAEHPVGEVIEFSK